MESKVVSTENAEHFVWGENCNGWWLKKNKSFSIIEEIMLPGASEKKHFHHVAEQFFYVLEGILDIALDNKEYRLAQNHGLTVEAQTIHQVFNKSNELVRFLVISCPDSHGDRIEVDIENYL